MFNNKPLNKQHRVIEFSVQLQTKNNTHGKREELDDDHGERDHSMLGSLWMHAARNGPGNQSRHADRKLNDAT